MSVLDWVLSITLLSIYIACLFTVLRLTFQKGYRVLGWLGIIFPILWLIGAVLPAKEGSQFAIEQAMARQQQVERMTR